MAQSLAVLRKQTTEFDVQNIKCGGDGGGWC